MAQRRFGRLEMIARDIVVGDDDGLGARPQRGDAGAQRIEQAAADDDVIAARSERDMNNRRIAANEHRHAPASCRGEFGALRNTASNVMISDTIASCGTSRDCTVMSAW